MSFHWSKKEARMAKAQKPEVEPFSAVLRKMINRRETPMELDRIADVCLNYRPKSKAKKAKRRKKRKAKRNV